MKISRINMFYNYRMIKFRTYIYYIIIVILLIIPCIISLENSEENFVGELCDIGYCMSEDNISPERIYSSMELNDMSKNLRKDNRGIVQVQNQKPSWRKEYSCFDSQTGKELSKNKKLCNEEGNIWDKPCESNYECPYFKKNKNYSNNRGKCKINGTCELPINMKRIGYRKYSENPKDRPFCYQCNESTPNVAADCCDEQIVNKSIPSPDYAFDKQKKKQKQSLQKNKYECYLTALNTALNPSLCKSVNT